MKLQEIKNIDITGKKVLLDVILMFLDEYNNITDDRRIRSA
jgi:phosphoglycerate kinase